MPKIGARRRPLVRTQKAKKVRTGAPLLETRARTILETMVEEVAAEPDGLKFPDALGPIASDAAPGAEEQLEETQSIDELATRDLVSIARHGASLEIDGSRYSPDELEMIAENVTDQAYLRIANSGGFTAKELSAIAQCGQGQVIFA